MYKDYAKQLEQNRAWYHKNKDKIKAKRRAEYASDPEKYKKRMRKYLLKSRYNMTIECYESMLEKQGGVCAVCGRTNNKKPLLIDHNHDTGKVRQLLCDSCNFLVGTVENRWLEMVRIKEYLRDNC
jgi:hypothetical protein